MGPHDRQLPVCLSGDGSSVDCWEVGNGGRTAWGAEAPEETAEPLEPLSYCGLISKARTPISACSHLPLRRKTLAVSGSLSFSLCTFLLGFTPTLIYNIPIPEPSVDLSMGQVISRAPISPSHPLERSWKLELS